MAKGLSNGIGSVRNGINSVRNGIASACNGIGSTQGIATLWFFYGAVQNREEVLVLEGKDRRACQYECSHALRQRKGGANQ